MYSDDYNNQELNQGYEETNNSNKGSYSKKMLWIVIAGIVLVSIVILYLWLGSGNETDTPGPITPQITISSQKENLSLGNSLPLKAIVTNIENATIVWTSSNEAVATVDSMGNVKGINYGTAIITATYLHTDNMPYSINCEVTVSEGNPNIAITDVRFPDGEVLLSEGSEFDLKVIIEPTDGYLTNIEYSSADETIVTVDQKGKIKGIGEGKTDIRLNANDGDFTDQITINVTSEQVTPQLFIPVDSIVFKQQLLTLVVGDTPQQLLYEILPIDALSSNLVWESSDPTVASVSGGIVSPLKVGTAIITVKSLDGETAIMTVEVKEKDVPVTGIEILNNSTTDTNYDEKNKTFNLKVNETARIFASVKPDNATNKEISYKSDKESVATVDDNGVVTAIGKGTVTITLTSKENSKITEKITVNVKSNSTSPGITGNSSSITLSDIEVTLGENKSIQFSDLELKENVSVTGCVIGNTGYANVSSVTTSSTNCTITPKAVGDTTFTIRISTGASKTVKLSIKESGQTGGNVVVTSVTLNTNTLSLDKGATATLIATISPLNATNKTVTLSSSNPSVATVDENGNVTAVATGTATITATTSNGKKATCTVTVTSTTTTVAVTGVSLNKTSLTLNQGVTATLIATISPSNATNKTVTLSSSNPSVATVDENGNVTAVATGTATITATTSNGITATCDVEVKDSDNNSTRVEEINVDQDNFNVRYGDIININISILPESAANKSFSCESQDSKIAILQSTTTNKCVFKANGVGSTKITIYANDGSGISKLVNVSVSKKCDSWEISEEIEDNCTPKNSRNCIDCEEFVECEKSYIYTIEYKCYEIDDNNSIIDDKSGSQIFTFAANYDVYKIDAEINNFINGKKQNCIPRVDDFDHYFDWETKDETTYKAIYGVCVSSK